MKRKRGWIKTSLVLLFVATMVASLSACQKDDEKDTQRNGEQYEIAMLSDSGNIEGDSFDQGIWSGIASVADERDISCHYYGISEPSGPEFADTIKQAVDSGAKVVVAAGVGLEEPVYAAQTIYPDVTFIMVDGIPHDEDGRSELAENTVAVVYAEEQSGYLAGYAAVKEGYTKLGFVGGVKSPSITCFGYGFAQGADAAAEEFGIPEVELKFTYTGSYSESPETERLAKEWFSDGTEAIFGCGGSLSKSIVSAAEQVGGKVIVADTDHNGDSETILTSAMKNLKGSIEIVLAAYYENAFPGGQTVVFDASNQGVMLPMGTSRFQQFTEADYDMLYEKLASGTVDLKKDDVATPYDLGLKRVRAVVVE